MADPFDILADQTDVRSMNVSLTIKRFLLLLALIFLTACVANEVALYEPQSVTNFAATIQGQITLLGTAVPETQFSKIYRDSQLCGEEVVSEELNVAEGSQGLEGIIVSLEGVTKGKPKPKEERIIIENRGCRFIPYMSATIIGSTLEVQNIDPILHTTHARFESRNGRTLWNIVQQAGAPGITKTLTSPGLVDIRCDLHPNMRSYVQVFSHPYFAITDADGYFEFKNVPAGNYQLTAWHSRIANRTKPITVPADGTVTADLGVQLKRQ
jgi:hypothetical protein